ncbi:MAG: uroporphyrinogen-III C-methyltransferase [Phycisphaerae bacterium]|nr:uroporphyrinogen-III C-methyltransferase [Phycisphaerae bacterium]
MRPGTVSLIGAGPGDPTLISVRGAVRIAQADVILYDRLANPKLIALARPDAELIDVGKMPDRHPIPQEEIQQLLVEHARADKRVVRLKGGDPFVFGRGGEECETLADAGVAFEVVPGITAAIAAPAYAGIPVTHRDWTATFALVTGHEDPTKAESNVDFSALARIGTVAFYMGVKQLGANCAKLMAEGLDPDTPAALIRWGTRPDQETLTATVSTIAARAEAEGVRPPAMTLIGRVVGLRDRLSWFERRPLFGRRIVVTRTRQQASELTGRLAQLGADVIEAPTIRIEPPEDFSAVDAALRRIGEYDWLVLTSVNGVDATVARMRACGLDARSLAGVRVAAIGSATADRLRQHFIEPEVVPEKFVAEALAEHIVALGDVRGQRFLLLRADIARPALRQALAEAGAVCEDLDVYRTLPAETLPDEVKTGLAEGGIDMITFTSSSTFTNFLALLDEAGRAALKDVQLASIGPITSETIRRAGYEPAVEAGTYTIAGLVEAIEEAGKE